MAKMRLPNGYGQIAYLRNQKLRNKYRVRVVTERDVNGKPSRYSTLGYFKNYIEALRALDKYHGAPSERTERLTLRQVYDKWITYYPTEKDASADHIRHLKNMWNHISCKDMPIGSIKPSHIRDDLMRPELPATVPNKMKVLYNLLFKYAVQEQYVATNIATQVTVPKALTKRENEQKRIKTAFTADELKKIKSMVGKSDVADALYYSCFSGWRPVEMIMLTPEDINITKGYAVGGSKTEAGKNRIVPIHPEVRSIINRRRHDDPIFKYKYYQKYHREFTRLMQDLGIDNHTPHDARRTFVTLAKQSGMDEYALKRIIGHTISDLTESVYTDRPVEWLIDEIKKIPKP